LMGLVVADCLLPRTPWPRGMLVGIATAIKLTPAVFVLFFLAHRQWRPVLVAGASFAAVTAVGFLAAPADSAKYWFGGVLTDPSRIGSPGFASNQSLAGLLHRWLLPAPWHTAIWLLAALVVLALGWVAAGRLRARGHDVAALLAVAAAGLLASPVSWSHHYVWVVPALIWGAHQARRSPRWWPALMVLAAGALVGPHWLVATREENLPEWDIGEQLIGNAYVWVCLLALFASAFGRLPPAATDPSGPNQHLGVRPPSVSPRSQRRVRIRVAPAATVDSSSQPTAVSSPATQADGPAVRHRSS
ncbi:MAG TPA: glycosyltransferase 87 family protein, partial [Pseudonocardiaceae bacterium]|nr:glycosyltransferase 87 family protein [Pseudonocardiaceae bacterium]